MMVWCLTSVFVVSMKVMIGDIRAISSVLSKRHKFHYVYILHIRLSSILSSVPSLSWQLKRDFMITVDLWQEFDNCVSDINL